MKKKVRFFIACILPLAPAVAVVSTICYILAHCAGLTRIGARYDTRVYEFVTAFVEGGKKFPHL